MAPLIIAALYGLMFLLIKLIAPLEMSNEVRLLLNVVGGIGALLLPLYIYSRIESRLTYRAVKQVGIDWCQDQGFEFANVEVHKNHYVVVYKLSEKLVRKKFRLRFIPTTWFVKTVDWLD